jgi:hypothetical protein
MAMPRSRRIAPFGLALVMLHPVLMFEDTLWFTAVHNYHASDRWTLISDMTGQNLYWGNNPFPDHRLSVQGYWDIREATAGSLRWSPTVALGRTCRPRSIVTQTGASPATSLG